MPMPLLPTNPPASSPATRKTMQGNRGKNTRPELELRRLLREAGFPGYRLHWKKAPGHPDIAYPGRKIAIFVNGCFWHQCPRCRPSLPRANAEFWRTKLDANVERDTASRGRLEALGWHVETVWECQLANEPAKVILQLSSLLRSRASDA